MTKIIIDLRMINHSGIGRYIRCILENLSTIPHSLDIYTFGVASKLVYYQWFDEYRHIEFKSGIFSIREHFEYLKLPKCDILWIPHFNIPILPIRAKYIATTIHDVYQLSHKNEFSFKERMYLSVIFHRITQKAKLIFTVSDFSKSEICKYTNIQKDRINKIYLGPSKLPHACQNIEEPYILYVGNVKPNKNLKRALQAFLEVQKSYPYLKFYIVGRKSGFRSGARELHELFEKNKSIQFTGYINDQELSNYYNSAKLLLFPSLYEGFGIPVLEALTFNLQVISSNIASMPEVGGNAVHYVDPFNVDDIAQKALNILKGNEWKTKAQIREQLEKFSWQKTTKCHVLQLENIESKK